MIRDLKPLAKFNQTSWDNSLMIIYDKITPSKNAAVSKKKKGEKIKLKKIFHWNLFAICYVEYLCTDNIKFSLGANIRQLLPRWLIAGSIRPLVIFSNKKHVLMVLFFFTGISLYPVKMITELHPCSTGRGYTVFPLSALLSVPWYFSWYSFI